MDETPNDNKNNDSNDVNDIYNNIYKVVSAEDIKKNKDTNITENNGGGSGDDKKKKSVFCRIYKVFSNICIFIWFLFICLYLEIGKNEVMRILEKFNIPITFEQLKIIFYIVSFFVFIEIVKTFLSRLNRK